eukprot:scaffold3920_cov134-Isochrysis_galbana.AAC.5
MPRGCEPLLRRLLANDFPSHDEGLVSAATRPGSLQHLARLGQLEALTMRVLGPPARSLQVRKDGLIEQHALRFHCASGVDAPHQERDTPLARLVVFTAELG